MYITDTLGGVANDTIWENDINILSNKDPCLINSFSVSSFTGKKHFSCAKRGATYEEIDNIGEVMDKS